MEETQMLSYIQAKLSHLLFSSASPALELWMLWEMSWAQSMERFFFSWTPLKDLMYKFLGSTERPSTIALHSSGFSFVILYLYKCFGRLVCILNTSKVLLETARLASVLPIAPPRKITGPIQVQPLHYIWSGQFFVSGWKTCAADR